MSLIFKKFVIDEGYIVSDETIQKMQAFFKEHKDSFPFYGGDIKTLLDKCKVAHMRKLIMLDKKYWKILLYKDIEDGFKIYLNQREITKEDNPVLSYFI